ncbi:MAG: hypothetical protein DME97_13550 [Verrucomicrobia bacterium]|nr:MAG: hypothetical protein DME97_13550 [Verrucomicrobiota bacterium]
MTYEPDEDDVKALRAMTLQQRLEGALDFTNQVRQFKMTSTRAHHPGWTEEKVMDELRRWVSRGMNPAELYPWWP